MPIFLRVGKIESQLSPIKFSRRTRAPNLESQTKKPHPNRFIFNLILWPREQLNFGGTTRNHFVQLKSFIPFQKLVSFDWHGKIGKKCLYKINDGRHLGIYGF